MKIRIGFVSNSSSSSFVALIRKDIKKSYTIDEIPEDIQNIYIEEDDETDSEEFNEQHLAKFNEVYTRFINGETISEYDESLGFKSLGYLDLPVIASMNASSDAGEVIPVLEKNLRKLLS